MCTRQRAGPPCMHDSPLRRLGAALRGRVAGLDAKRVSQVLQRVLAV